MYKRDAGILLLACVAMVVSLQREGMFSFRKAWFHSFDESSTEALVAHHLLPPLVVADLNGDGHLELIVATPSLKIQVLTPAPPSSVESGFASAKVVSQVSLLSSTVGASAARRPVAMAVGYLDHAPKERGVMAPRKQVLVVVTAGLEVLCYDHNLKLMWERDISNGQLLRHSRVKEVALLVTPHQVGQGDRGLIVVGASVQRGDLSSGDAIEHLAGRNGHLVDEEDDEDVLAALERRIKDGQQHAHSAGDAAKLQDLDQQAKAVSGSSGGSGAAAGGVAGGAIKGLDASRHFSYHGLEGGSGQERWHHLATDFHKDLPELAQGLRPQNDYRLDAEKLEGRHFGEASCRQYRESLLHQALPHTWSGPLDTRLVEAHFAKHRTSRGASKAQLATRGAKGRVAHSRGSVGHQHQPPSSHASSSHASSSSASSHLDKLAATSRLLGAHGMKGVGSKQHGGAAHTSQHQGAVGGAGRAARALHEGQQQQHHANGTSSGALAANALVVHLEEGLEVVHLFTGRTICQLHLPRGELHADINGDGVMDHVQVYHGSDVTTSGDMTALAAEAGGRRHHGASHCTALTTSGIPPQHHLWQANVCRSNRFMSSMAQGAGAGSLLSGGGVASGGGQEDSVDGVEILTPVFLPLPRLNKGYGGLSHHHGLVVVLNSRGEVVALSSRGAHVWQSVHDHLRWEPSHETEQDAEEAAAQAPTRPTLLALSLHVHGVPGAVLAAGRRGALVLSEHGRELASVEFPLPPTQRIVVADFSGDGLNDLVEVTSAGLFGWTQVQHVGGGTLSTLLLVATAAMALLVWNSGGLVGAGGPGGTAAQRKLRSTEYTD